MNLRAIISGSIGNLVEWYDWYVYAAFTFYFAPTFFPQTDPELQLLNSAGIFAVGFLMRPLGGWFFGRMADKIGRKKSMTFSVILMSAGSFIIAFTPSYSQIGIIAPILLLLARLIQGLSVGGEYGISATYLSEIATKNRRGFYSSFQYVTLIGGQLIALGIQLILQKILSEDSLYTWGWRIPFLIGACLSLIALYLRSHLEETVAFKNVHIKKENKGSIKNLLAHPKAIGIVMGLTIGGTVAFYTYTTYMQKFLVNTVKLTKSSSTVLTFFSLLFFAIIQPFFGMLSDRIGRKPILIFFGIAGTLATVPLLTILSNTTEVWKVFLLLLVALIIVSGYTSISAIVKAELFPTSIRALGVGLPFSIAVALFGGTVEYIALWLKRIGYESTYYWYVTGCILISLLVYLFMMNETKKTSLIDKEEKNK